MELKEVTRKLNYSYSTILEAKVRNFLRKSIFMHLISSFLLFMAVNQVMQVENKVLIFISVYVVLLLASVLIIIISGFFQFQKRKHKTIIISFMEGTIYVTDELTGMKVERRWDWINQVQLLKGTYYFDLNDQSKEVIALRRRNLTELEDGKLQTWIRSNSRLIL